ncbi:MAG: ABC transporter ATP-binding protein [Pseudolabrys sp.]|jgi:branched-chain amino acid transport system ATP-binding protein
MSALLTVDKIGSGYGDIPVLRDVSLQVGANEIVSVVGANGAGKTTLLRSIAGLLPCTHGTIQFDGQRIDGLPAHKVVVRGLVMVPEGGRLFLFMSIQENLELGAFNNSARPQLDATLEEVFTLFPILASRRHQLAGSLSGGERQMCAIARAVMSRPKLLMLDEPSLGLSPLMVERVFEIIVSLAHSKKITVLLVEQNVGDALDMAQRGYVVERGQIVKTGSGPELLADPEVQHSYLGL